MATSLRPEGRIDAPLFRSQLKSRPLQNLYFSQSFSMLASGRPQNVGTAVIFAIITEAERILSLRKDCPDPRRVQPPSAGKIVAFPEIGGLHHRYERRVARATATIDRACFREIRPFPLIAWGSAQTRVSGQDRGSRS